MMTVSVSASTSEVLVQGSGGMGIPPLDGGREVRGGRNTIPPDWLGSVTALSQERAPPTPT